MPYRNVGNIPEQPCHNKVPPKPNKHEKVDNSLIIVEIKIKITVSYTTTHLPELLINCMNMEKQKPS